MPLAILPMLTRPMLARPLYLLLPPLMPAPVPMAAYRSRPNQRRLSQTLAKSVKVPRVPPHTNPAAALAPSEWDSPGAVYYAAP